MTFTVPRGTKDILPEEMPFWHEIEQVSREVFDRYNFDEIRTPIFESTELFSKSIGDNTDIVEKEMYTFKDKSDRSLTLRPEGTAPIARAFIQNKLYANNSSAKLYYIGPMFRYERPQAGRFRQFHQIGVEHIGCASPAADAEIIALGIHLFDELGLEGLSVAINSVGCPTCRPVIEERIKQFLSNNLKFLCEDCQRRFIEKPMRLLDCKKKTCSTYLSGMPDIRSSHCQECRDHFDSVLEYLDALGVAFSINPRLVRGLDYYTRTTFEILSDKLGAQNAICGGGRYDFLVKSLGGPSSPATGFAFGVERAVMILKDMVNTQKNQLVAYFIPIGEMQRNKCFAAQNELRRAGIKCSMGYEDNLKAQMKKANKLNAKFVVIYGDEESEKGKAILKNMEKGDQEEVTLKQLKSKLKSHAQ